MRFTFSFTKYLQDEMLLLKTCLLHSLLVFWWVVLLIYYKRSRRTTKVLQPAVTHSTTGQHGVPDQTNTPFSLSHWLENEGDFLMHIVRIMKGLQAPCPSSLTFLRKEAVVGWSLWFKYWVSLILWGFLCLHNVKLSWDNIYEPIHKISV